jgi:hypothetical protein
MARSDICNCPNEAGNNQLYNRAAIYNQNMSGHIAGSIGSQENCCTHHLVRFRYTLQRSSQRDSLRNVWIAPEGFAEPSLD